MLILWPYDELPDHYELWPGAFVSTNDGCIHALVQDLDKTFEEGEVQECVRIPIDEVRQWWE